MHIKCVLQFCNTITFITKSFMQIKYLVMYFYDFFSFLCSNFHEKKIFKKCLSYCERAFHLHIPPYFAVTIENNGPCSRYDKQQCPSLVKCGLYLSQRLTQMLIHKYCHRVFSIQTTLHIHLITKY